MTLTGLHCGIGSCGVPRPSLADYVRGPKATRGAIAAEACYVAYAPRVTTWKRDKRW